MGNFKQIILAIETRKLNCLARLACSLARVEVKVKTEAEAEVEPELYLELES